MKRLKLDSYEQKILSSFENNEWKSVKNAKKEIKKHQEYARNTIKKDKRVNIRISSKDLENVQVLALQEGIPYQTLIASVIHKFINGSLINAPITRRSSGR